MGVCEKSMGHRGVIVAALQVEHGDLVGVDVLEDDHLAPLASSAGS